VAAGADVIGLGIAHLAEAEDDVEEITEPTDEERGHEQMHEPDELIHALTG